MKKVLIICGPTATGKTALAARLAKKFNGELISADSRQVYQGMDIVTGKDRPVGVKIHGLDLVNPDEEFSVAHFVQFAQQKIKELHARKKLPILVGGTGLYLKSLVNPPNTLSVPPDWQLRKDLENISARKLLKLLKQLNPAKVKSMNHSDRHNPRRLTRAIEVAKSLSGSTLPVQNYDALWIGLMADKKTLDKKIARRVRARIKAGAIEEWQKLKAKYSSTLPSMTSIGYRELPDVNAWIRSERHYARRQLTYFKKLSNIYWNPAVVKLVRDWYT